MTKRDDVYLGIITELNERKLGGRFLFDCGAEGYALVYWEDSCWKVVWFDQAVPFLDSSRLPVGKGTRRKT